MLFNSFEFLWFFPLFFGIYWFLLKDQLKLQNGFIVAASYLFYGWWDYRFLALIFASSVLDYFIGIGMENAPSKRQKKWLLAGSLAFNLGMLGFFKYCNFFIESWIDLWSMFGFESDASTLQIILPVGISFYTFQTLSYSIDVYRGNLKPTRDFVQFLAYVSFFPQLVAGPIERATNLLPQFNKVRVFTLERAKDGTRQILWGFFKKIVIADGCAKYVNTIFDHPDEYSGIFLIAGAVLFAFQIYCDFSGYSDIAIGTARILGFDLMTNFRTPYFSRDIAEFWRRWHISLSTWFRDYLYIPLGGSKGGTWMKVRNTFIIFLVSGFWHGSKWTFVIWGGLNALYFLPLLLANKNRKNTQIESRSFPGLKEVSGILFTFLLTCFAWIFFRADSVGDAFTYLKEMVQNNFLGDVGETLQLLVKNAGGNAYLFLFLLGFIGLMLLVEWKNKTREHGLKIEHWKPLQRQLMYVGVILLIAFYGTFEETAFIYFQF